MEVRAERYGHALILNCKGDLTEDTLDAFTLEMEQHLAEDVTDVALNLAEAPFGDSAALEYLLGLQDQLQEKAGQLTVTNLVENVAKVFEMTRLDQNFAIATDVMEAVQIM